MPLPAVLLGALAAALSGGAMYTGQKQAESSAKAKTDAKIAEETRKAKTALLHDFAKSDTLTPGQLALAANIAQELGDQTTAGYFVNDYKNVKQKDTQRQAFQQDPMGTLTKWLSGIAQPQGQQQQTGRVPLGDAGIVPTAPQMQQNAQTPTPQAKGSQTGNSGPSRTGTDMTKNMIVEAANKYGVNPAEALALAHVESSFDVNAVSPKSAVGTMQLMKDTAKQLGGDRFKVADNIDMGVRYYKAQLDRFGTPELAAAAYNAGPEAVAQYGGIPPYKETKNHVKKFQEFKNVYAQQQPAQAQQAAPSTEGMAAQSTPKVKSITLKTDMFGIPGGSFTVEANTASQFVLSFDRARTIFSAQGMPENKANANAALVAFSDTGSIPPGFGELLNQMQATQPERAAGAAHAYYDAITKGEDRLRAQTRIGQEYRIDPKEFETFDTRMYEKIYNTMIGYKMTPEDAAAAASNALGGFSPQWARDLTKPQRPTITVPVQQELRAQGVTDLGKIPDGNAMVRKAIEAVDAQQLETKTKGEQAKRRGEALEGQKNILSKVQQLEDLSRVVHNYPSLLRPLQGVLNSLSVITQAGPDAPKIVQYKRLSQAFLGNFARYYGGEKGTLQQKDIDRAAGFIPGLWDSRDVAKRSFESLRKLAEELDARPDGSGDIPKDAFKNIPEDATESETRDYLGLE